MNDRWAIALAGSTAIGALLPLGVPLAPGVVLTVVAFALRRPWLLCLAAALLASSLATRAWNGLAPPEARPFSGWVSLVSDPDDVSGGARADVRIDGKRYEAWAWGAAGVRLSRRLAGEQVEVAGTIEPPRGSTARLVPRHVVGRLAVDQVFAWRSGGLPSRLANGLRRSLVEGAESLPGDQRALFTGLTIGDDRAQSDVVADDFRAAGLTHLLAVSGQNVAFVLIVSRPLLARLGPSARLLGTVTVLGFFALVTRFEPSVLRATTMAALAATALALGRPASTLRLLALAVALLILVDPLLVHSIAFRLSVAASLGIVVLAAPLARRIPGPRMLGEALAVTVSAQAAVAPLLVHSFGGVPVASVPANLLAGPAAGPVMVWGLTGGLVAGAVGGPLAAAIHLPTRVLIGWIEGVAAAGATVPLGRLEAGHLAALVPTAAVLWFGRRNRVVRPLAIGATIVVLALPAVMLGRSPPLETSVAQDSSLWRAGGAAVLELGPTSTVSRVLADLRHAGARRLDIVAVASGSPRAQLVVDQVAERVRIDALWTNQNVAPGAETRVGDLSLRVIATEPRLELRVERVRGPPGELS